jgi:hypothetical protein
VAFQFVEADAPHRAIRLEPRVEFDEWFRSETVEATLTVRAHAYESRIA